MSLETFDAVVDWLAGIVPAEGLLSITFHGGEPLMVGFPWYRHALPCLRKRLGARLELKLQSNLWLLTPDLCDLFREYGVKLGCSLDGPEPLNDLQRGAGYFRRTWQGLQLARGRGFEVGLICTFTSRSMPFYPEVFDFFATAGLPFSIHGAVAGLDQGPSEWALSPQGYAELMIGLFDLYLQDPTRNRLSAFDHWVQGMMGRRGLVCTFGPCLGRYLALAPDGGIYPCNRFVPHSAWEMGRVQDRPAWEELERTAVWGRLAAREVMVREECGACLHFDYCQGGCAYDAGVAGVGARDPYCPAYRRIFDYLIDRALDEVFPESE